MTHDRWLDRWRTGTTGWHRDTPHPILQSAWPGLDLAPTARVLVPLCGATPDLRWLRDAGHEVVGVELSPIACARFFDDHGLAAERSSIGPYTRWTAHGITILQGDVFDLVDAGLPAFDAVYDRAATIALPPDVRGAYARTVARSLQPGASGLLVTLEDPDRGDEGPPFSVDATAARAAWGHAVALTRLDPVDGQSPREAAWQLVRHAPGPG